MAHVQEVELERFTVPDLKKLCREKSLKVTGRKAELVRRISQFLESESAGGTQDGTESKRRRRQQSQQEIQAPSDAKRADVRECVICVDKKALRAFPGKITAQCTHMRDVCRACVGKTINLEVNGKGNSTRVICPHAGCSAVLAYEDVRRESSKAVFEHFDQMLFRKALQEEPTFRWCAHAGCGSGQMVEDLSLRDAGWNRFLTCHSCSRRTCAHHRCEWHAGRTCQQYEADARRSDEVALLQYFQREGVKRCPKCGHAIEKNGGCDHMTCRREAGGCGAEFCIRCLAEYNGSRGIRARGNSAHRPSCPWYFPDPDSDEDS